MNGMTELAGDPDQRQSIRVTLRGPIDCIGEGVSVRGELGEIGVGGMFMDSHASPFQPDELVRVKFSLGPELPRLELRAQILYVQERLGIGMRFLELAAATRAQIEDYLRRTSATAGPPLRKSSRVCVNIPVALWPAEEQGAGFGDASIVTLSKYGACVETSQRLAIGARVGLATRSGLKFKGNVVWIGGAPMGSRAQAGVQCRGLAQALGFQFP
jgi:PilZ domain